LFMKIWTIYGERLFKCHNLGQSLWPANQKQLFMKIWTIYDERLFKHHHLGQSLWPANQKPIVYENLDNIWWEAI
jgi:hypothetical protein